MGELVGEVTAASHEQAQGIEQINKAVAEMDKVVQQNAASAEESASASEEMNAQAEQMKGFVSELVALVGGNNGNGRGSVKRSPIGGDGNSLSALSQYPKLAMRKTLGTLTKKVRGKETNAGAQRKTKEIRPDQIIPLTEENFKEF